MNTNPDPVGTCGARRGSIAKDNMKAATTYSTRDDIAILGDMAAKQTFTDVVEYDTKRAHAGDLAYARNLPKTPCFLSYDPSFEKVIGASPKITLVEERKDKFAHEAGVYIKSTNKNYFTSNYQSNRTIETYSVDCDTHEITEDKYDDVVTANGA